MSRQQVQPDPATVGVRLTPRTPLAHIVAALRKQYPTASANELIQTAMELQRRSRASADAARRAAAEAAVKPLPTLDPEPAPAEPEPVKPRRAPRKRTKSAAGEVEGESSRW